ncbi:MAG: NTP transferase domain-containing protein [Clostridia bacterium]|nr:NTP transferase domain-containing protein [Clostridia bacterium]
MNIKEFDVLRYFCENHGIITQRLVSDEVGQSLGSVNSIISKLQKAELIDEGYQVTQKGLELMKPYKVKNAIILAAGMSTRFIPVSYELPKGLISVKGEIMIEREIEQLQEAGVQEIVVVVGYMMEKFFYLRDKYNVKLVVNNEFSTKNTHSSVYVARDYLSNTYIICSDNYYPKNMFHQYEYRAYYCSIFLPGISYVERAFQFDRDGLIYDTNKPSHDQWIMYGHAYFDNSFTEKFKPVLESYFGRPGVEGMYWENVWAENVKTIPLWIKQCSSSQILEFDSMDELKAFDPDYIHNNKVKVFENICRILCCDISDIDDVVTIKKGLNNQSFKFRVNGDYYIYRHPGVNASGVIDRKKEAASLRAAKRLKIDETLVYIDEEEGWKISKFIETTATFDFGNKKHIDLLAEKLKILHQANLSVGFGFDYQKEGDRIIEILKHIDAMAYRRSLAEKESMIPVFEYLQENKWQVSLCHNDLYEPNLLLDGDNLYVIDWEFSGDADIGFDICKLFAVHNPPFEEYDYWLEKYYGRKTERTEKLHLIACAAVIYYYWYIWGIYAGKNNQDVSDYMMAWYDKMNSFRKKAIEMLNEE